MGTFRKSNVVGQVVTTFTVDDLAITTAKLAAGAITEDKRSLLCRNETGGTLTAGTLVYVSGWNETQTRPLISKADANVAGARATWVLQADLANNTNGTVYKTYRFTAQNVGGSVGDPAYLSETAGGWTLTAPTAAGSIQQVVGRGAVVHASTGVVEFNLDANNQVTIGTNEIQAKGVTAAKIALADGAVLIGDATGVSVGIVPTGDVTVTNTGVTAIGAGKVTNAMVVPAALDGTVAKVVANANVIGGIHVVHRIDITAGALGDTDVVLTHKTRVIDAHLVLRGAGVASTTLQVKNGANAITDAMAASGSDTAIVRAATLNDANYEIAAGGTLRVTSATGATQPDATVYVTGLRVT